MRRTVALLSVLSFSACGGGGGSSAAPQIQNFTPGPVTPTAAPTATPTPAIASSASLLLAQSGGTVTVGAGGTSATLSFPAVSAGAGATLQLFASTNLPQSLPQIQSVFRLPKTATGILYLQVTTNQNVSSGMPTFSSNTTISGIALFSPTASSWNYTSYTSSGLNTFVSSGVFVLAPGQSYYFALFTGTPNPTASPTPTPTSTPLPATPTPTPTAAPTRTATPTPIPASGAPLLPITFAPNGGWAPYAVANAFQFPVQSGYNGLGLTIAIVGDYPASLNDVRAYLLQFGIQGPGTYVVENVGSGSPMTDQAGFQEATLDVETVAGLAPGVNIIFYAMPDLSGNSFVNAYNQIISDGKARVVSISFGGCEASSDSTVFDPILKQGAAQGIAFVAAAGDSGDRCQATSPPGVSHPASDPNVIAVGGTETNNSINSTRAWNDTLSVVGQQATGGGISVVFPLPSYQAGLGASSSFRNVPDLAMPASADAIYFQGQWLKIVGTSWSAPQVAAMIAEIYQYCNSPFGLTRPSGIFYSPFNAKQYSNFLDVTTGNNQFGGDSVYFSGRTGFDNVSGIGIPLGMPIAQTLCPNRVPASLARSTIGALTLETPARAEATLLRNVPNLRGLQGLGRRADSSPTNIALVLRTTATLPLDEQIVIASLKSAGFAIIRTYSNHLVINAQAPASVVARYFQTTLENFSQGRYGIRYANVSPVTLPASIAPYVQGAITDNVISAFPLSNRALRERIR